MKLNEDKTVLLKIEANDIDECGHFKVPESVSVIDKYVVGINAKRTLKSVDISKASIIGEYAFGECRSLETVTGSPATIIKGAFADCKRLAEFDFSNTTSLGSGAFARSGLTKADISGIKTIPENTFINCSNLKEVTGSPVVIKNHAFAGCVTLEVLNLSNVKELSLVSMNDSKLSKSVGVTPKIIKTFFGRHNYNFARLGWNFDTCYRISDVIDSDRNAYIDIDGIPFIIDASGLLIKLTDDRNKFMKLWSSQCE